MKGPDPRERELEVLRTIARALNASLTLDEALATALDECARLFGLETGWIWLLDPDSEASYLAAARALPPALAEHPERMTGGCYCLDGFRAGELDTAANVPVIRCSRLRHLRHGTQGLAFHTSVPIEAHGRGLGLLNLGSRDRSQLDAEELRLLYTVADLLGIAVERARLHDASAELGALRERNRLAREIHDTLAQGLAGIALQLEAAEVARATGPGWSRAVDEVDPDRPATDPAATDPLDRALARALALTRESLEDARRSVLDLRAAPLEGRSLPDALRALVLDAVPPPAEAAPDEAVPGRPRVEVEIIDGERPLPARVEAGLYRIAEEALRNALGHAGASRIGLRLALTPERALLRIQDDGRGFDPGRLPSGRFGIAGMRERARLLAGTFELATSSMEGTAIEVEVPLT